MDLLCKNPLHWCYIYIHTIDNVVQDVFKPLLYKLLLFSLFFLYHFLHPSLWLRLVIIFQLASKATVAFHLVGTFFVSPPEKREREGRVELRQLFESWGIIIIPSYSIVWEKWLSSHRQSRFRASRNFACSRNCTGLKSCNPP